MLSVTSAGRVLGCGASLGTVTWAVRVRGPAAHQPVPLQDQAVGDAAVGTHAVAVECDALRAAQQRPAERQVQAPTAVDNGGCSGDGACGGARLEKQRQDGEQRDRQRQNLLPRDVPAALRSCLAFSRSGFWLRENRRLPLPFESVRWSSIGPGLGGPRGSGLPILRYYWSIRLGYRPISRRKALFSSPW